MARKTFIADFEISRKQNIPGISSVARGENDEDINVSFVPHGGVPIEIVLLAQPDLSSYPTKSFFMIFTRSEGVPSEIAAALEGISALSVGLRIPDLVVAISRKLQSLLAVGGIDDPILVSDGSDVEMLDITEEPGIKERQEEEDNNLDESEDEVDYGGFSSDEERGTDNKTFGSITHHISPEAAKKANRRIRQDLRAARNAGFSVGILNGMKADSVSSLVSLSIRVSKLGVSEEAVQAWDLEPHAYIVLLIRYSNGYKPFENVMHEPVQSMNVEFRIGVCDKYKPTLVEALATFTDVSKRNHKSKETGDKSSPGDNATDPNSGFTNMFISSSLNDFLNTQFVSLLKIRFKIGVGWDGAKKYLSDKQGRMGEDAEDLLADYYQEENHTKDILPEVTTADHLTDSQVKDISFPLIVAQFMLRYLTRCTEFCLVCHDKISEEFGALKPYVCNKPLCLYQYMSLGFGPSVEHEILTQPYVVDLLVSFCYASAMNRNLREYPTGMSLAVPPVSSFVTNENNTRGAYMARPAIPADTPTISLVNEEKALPVALDVSFDPIHSEIIFTANQELCPVHNGDWVMLTSYNQLSRHYRVEDISLFPTVKLSDGIPRESSASTVSNLSVASANPAIITPVTSVVSARMWLYDRNFDEMTDVEKAETIIMALETLPSISVLRTYLLDQARTSEPNLKVLKERISPAALGILRWIVASNRSCIIQVDKCPGQSDADIAAARIRLDQKVANVSESWVQFRFAQGSPDKEQKFLNALKAQEGNFDPQYPTLFAFHGSPLQNWHSIIRQGLDFKEIAHGRAYGNGVYHSQDQTVSMGYAMHNNADWHGSGLMIANAMSLNEIVNCPSQFTSTSPHIVVQHIDWIQCRYLFVQVRDCVTSGNSNTISNAPDPATEVILQDPKFVARSTLHKPIGVPLCAVAVSRAFRINANNDVAHAKFKQASGNKRRKVIPDISLLGLAAITASEEEDISDINFLFSDDENKGESGEKHPNPCLSAAIISTTDFEPSTLNQSELPMLDPPSYATPTATKTLNRALQEVLEVQKKTPAHELGWYIDPALINNVYQWIIELHSFEDTLPLAKDMKRAGLTSVVLEMRFGKDFPFSPPFVRVIRPRFLPFMQGGGGHVTAGGAICMELLTNSGWSSVSSLESVFLQVRLAISSTDPRPARLESITGKRHDYGTAEAIDAYIRACRQHGWQIPAGFVEGFGQAGLSSY